MSDAIPALLETLHIHSIQLRRLVLRVLTRFPLRPTPLTVRAEKPAPRPEQLRDERAVRLPQTPAPQEPGELPERTLSRWAADFLPYGHELCVRIALAAARRVVGLWEVQYSLGGSPRDALHAVADWLCAPNELAAQAAVSLGDFIPSQLCAASAFSASWATTFATLCVTTDEQRAQWTRATEPLGPAEGGFLGSAVFSACRALGNRSVITLALGGSEDPPQLSPEEAANQVRKAIVDDVLPWDCGTWDPVKDVLQRRRELLSADRHSLVQASAGGEWFGSYATKENLIKDAP